MALYAVIPELSEEEKKLPLAKYFEEYPLLDPTPLECQLLDSGPMAVSDAVPAANWLDILQPSGYRKVEFGYCMMPDGSGYYAEYFVTPPSVTPEMMPWFLNWINYKSKNTPEGQGNLRYKLWYPPDHWEHTYVNGKDDKDGVWSFGTLDNGKSGAKNGSEEISYPLDLREYGLSEERIRALKEAGCTFSAACEKVEGGHHLVLRLQRPCPYGGTETFNHEWIGYCAQDGKIIQDKGTPVNEEYLRNVLIHNITEHHHLPRFLPKLYAEYHDKPIDAD
ncbi:MAG: hypothetical protein LUD12_16250 [Lachnospiraceae bacterium]|nr:hypothetical protein [Lachnospiraceae bacterium]